MGSVATLGAAALPAIKLGQYTETDTNLVPTTPAVSPSYWCTWSAQNYMYGRGAKDLDVKVLEGNSGHQIAHDQINEEMLLGSAGWAKRFFPSIRTDIYLLLDDGWGRRTDSDSRAKRWTPSHHLYAVRSDSIQAQRSLDDGSHPFRA
jgi:hypothetical protein